VAVAVTAMWWSEHHFGFRSAVGSHGSVPPAGGPRAVPAPSAV